MSQIEEQQEQQEQIVQEGEGVQEVGDEEIKSEMRQTSNFGQSRILKEEMNYKFTYATWREDKEADAGYSKELISCDTDTSQGPEFLDSLECWPFEDKENEQPGIRTLYHAFKRNLFRKPNQDMMGSRVGDKYEWIKYRQVADMAEHLSYGLIALELVPEQ